MKNLYETSDYQVATVLIALSIRLINVDRSNPHRAIFQFEYTQAIEESVRKFHTDQLLLNPRHVLLNAKLLKDRLHSGV